MMDVLLDVDERGFCWCRVASIPDASRPHLVHTLCAHGWMVRTPFAGRGGWPQDHVYAIRQQRGNETTRELVSACLVLQDALLDLGVELVNFGDRLEMLAASYITRPPRQRPSC